MEGCKAVMTYLFEELGITANLSGTRLENSPSVRLLERLGLHTTGLGEFRISKEEWLAQQKANQNQLS
jgi:RimJ/RimL family protein N-acetyltransferase